MRVLQAQKFRVQSAFFLRLASAPRGRSPESVCQLESRHPDAGTHCLVKLHIQPRQPLQRALDIPRWQEPRLARLEYAHTDVVAAVARAFLQGHDTGVGAYSEGLVAERGCERLPGRGVLVDGVVDARGGLGGGGAPRVRGREREVGERGRERGRAAAG